MALSNLTKVQTVGIGSNIEVVGVVTTGQFKSGTSNLHSTGVELTNLNVSGIATIGGNLSIGGTLTYQDVTNIDSVGLITARAGVNVSGGQLDVGSNIKLGNAGVVTATSFVGSGANLTGITQTTINNNADNRIITGSGTANTLNGEANLTFDGSTLGITGAATLGNGSGLNWGDTSARIRGESGSSGLLRFDTNGSERLRIRSGGEVAIGGAGYAGQPFSVQTSGNNLGYMQSTGTTRAVMNFVDANSTQNVGFGCVGNNHVFTKDGNEKVRIDSSGRLLIGTTTEGNESADELTVASSGNTGITIRSGTSSNASIFFTDATSGADEYRGFIQYIQSNDILKFGTATSERLRIDSSGRLGLSHDLSGTADYNRMMIYNPNSGSCWIQMMSTATGTGANTDGLSIGLNTSNIAHFWLRENAEMHFATNNSLRWRITSSGDIYPQGNYKIGLNSNTAFRMSEVNSNKFVHRYGNSGSATNNQQEAIWYGGGITVMHDNATLSTSSYTWGLTGHRGYALFRLKNSGGQAIYAESGSITSNSDYRMKENIVEITNGIETVKKLKPSEYNIRKTFNPLDDGKKHHGFVAHEVQEAIPDIGNIVSGTKDAVQTTEVDKDKPDYQGIDYGHMTPVLAAAIKELITKVETLETKFASLEGS